MKVLLVLDDACLLGGPTLSYVESSGLFLPVDNSQIYRHVGLVDGIGCIVEQNLSYTFWPWVYLRQPQQISI